MILFNLVLESASFWCYPLMISANLYNFQLKVYIPVFVYFSKLLHREWLFVLVSYVKFMLYPPPPYSVDSKIDRRHRWIKACSKCFSIIWSWYICELNERNDIYFLHLISWGKITNHWLLVRVYKILYSLVCVVQFVYIWYYLYWSNFFSFKPKSLCF